MDLLAYKSHDINFMHDVQIGILQYVSTGQISWKLSVIDERKKQSQPQKEEL